MNILLVDDDKKSRAYLSSFLMDIGHAVAECPDGETALEAFQTQEFPIVLTDIRMPGMSGLEFLRNIRGLPVGHNVSVILMTGYADLQTAIEAMRCGAYDYLQKPIKLEELVIAIDRAAEHQVLRRENEFLTNKFESAVRVAAEATTQELVRLKEAYFQIVGLGDIVIFSDTMKKVYQQAQTLHAERSVPVLIEGETGTGKELVARYIHYGEESVTLPFVDLNCAALAPSIFESELFGYDAGAYTGGLPRGQKGKLDMAQGGTLFLDEITEIPVELQAKLLRVIQEKEFYRVGGLKKFKTDVRIICATNVDIEQKVEQGAFRKDLFYRLNVARIYLPPLRERRDDIIPLVEMFLTRFSKEKRKNFKTISKSAVDLLLSYEWPGNIRELRNLIEWAVLMHDDTELKPLHLKLQKAHSQSDHEETASASFVLPPYSLPLKPFIDEIILRALEMHHGNKVQTAHYLDIPLRTLYNRLK
ncbi:MAG: sigma-54 dependent transcriptional regulator [Thermacetogeniaceae bacterium]